MGVQIRLVDEPFYTLQGEGPSAGPKTVGLTLRLRVIPNTPDDCCHQSCP